MMKIIKKVIHMITSDKGMTLLAYVGFGGMAIWGFALIAYLLILNIK